jgi:hypothetical protein
VTSCPTHPQRDQLELWAVVLDDVEEQQQVLLGRLAVQQAVEAKAADGRAPHERVLHAHAGNCHAAELARHHTAAEGGLTDGAAQQLGEAAVVTQRALSVHEQVGDDRQHVGPALLVVRGHAAKRLLHARDFRSYGVSALRVDACQPHAPER